MNNNYQLVSESLFSKKIGKIFDFLKNRNIKFFKETNPKNIRSVTPSNIVSKNLK